MQLNRCPICHARIGLDALVQDEAGRELLGLLVKMDIDSGAALVGYLSLFRSTHRDLASDRALKLAREALALDHPLAVAQAMRKTLDSLQSKSTKPLSNHNYLKQVLADGQGVGVALAAPMAAQAAAPKTSKTAQALQALKEFGNG